MGKNIYTKTRKSNAHLNGRAQRIISAIETGDGHHIIWEIHQKFYEDICDFAAYAELAEALGYEEGDAMLKMTVESEKLGCTITLELNELRKYKEYGKYKD